MQPREKQLLISVVGVLAIVGGLVASKHLLAWQHALQRKADTASQETAEMDALLQQSADWNERGAWLEAHQPVANSKLEAENELFDTLMAKAQAAGISFINRQYQEPVAAEYYHQFGVTLTVKGDLPAIFGWIYGMQSPSQFCVVPYLKITPDKDDTSKIVCTAQFWRWYQPSKSKSA